MSDICSTCKYNGGCFSDIRETFKIPETTPNFWDSFVFCKRPGKNSRIVFNEHMALVLPAKTLKDCDLWEASDGRST